jgi:hypothetical protein
MINFITKMKLLKRCQIFLYTLLFFLILSSFHNQAYAAWEIVPGANNNTNISSVLYGTAAVSSSDVWSVGLYYPDSSSPAKPLIERWNPTQSQWSSVSGGDIGTDYGWLQSVSVVSANDV